MAAKHPPTTASKDTEAEARLQEALAVLKAASDRKAAIVDVMSRLGVSPQERRLAQSESKKVDRQVDDAKRLVQAAKGGAAAPSRRAR